MKGLNKFLKNKNTVTILGVLICLVILYTGYNMRINQKTALTTVYYANQDIQPKTQITKDMISRMEVPLSFIKGSYYKKYEDIEGKYSGYNTMIAEGSIFYSSLLMDEASLPDAILTGVEKDEELVMFPVNTATTYGNAIMPGNVVNIYVKLRWTNGKLVYGRMYENVEILAVRDSAGKNVFDSTSEERTPAYVYFSLKEAQYLLFSSLKYITDSDIEIVLVPNTNEFDAGFSAEITSLDLFDFVKTKIQQIDDQKQLYDALDQHYAEYQNSKEMKELNKENTNQ